MGEQEDAQGGSALQQKLEERKARKQRRKEQGEAESDTEGGDTKRREKKEAQAMELKELKKRRAQAQAELRSKAGVDDVEVTVSGNPLCESPGVVPSEPVASPVEKEEEAETEPPVPIGMQVHYAFDNWMMKASSAFVLIAIMTVILLIFGGIALKLVDAKGSDETEVAPTYLEGMWKTWLYVNDGAAHTELVGGARAVGAAISLAGMLIFAMLMGFIFDLITVNMEELRKGKSKVVERDHTLILGWSDKLFTILTELCDANSSRPDGTSGGVIVILSDKLPKEDMLAELNERIPEETRQNSKFVIRFGSPMLTYDLAKVACNAARSIIILCDDDGAPEKADAAVLRVVVSLGGALTTSTAHIVSEIRDVDCLPLLNLVGCDRVEAVVSHDIVGRLMVMSVRQPGLSDVYSCLLGFEGDEFYIEEWPEALGLPFGDLQQHFPDCIPLGIRDANGVVIMKPNMARTLQEGDEILVLSEDDDTYNFDMDLQSDDPEGYDPHLEWTPGPGEVVVDRSPEKILIVGWRRDVRDILNLINELVLPGSEVHIVAEKELEDREEALDDAGLDVTTLTNLEMIHHVGHARRHFEKLPLQEFTSCVIVADEESEEDLMNSDSVCIQTLLLIRDVQMNRKGQGNNRHDVETQLETMSYCPILVETLDSRTQECVKTSKPLQAVANFVQSNEMVSRVLAMVSEEKSVNIILAEMLGGRGCGLQLKPVVQYLNSPDEELTFMQLCKRAQEVREIAVGYQIRDGLDCETFMNPRDKFVPKNWQGLSLVVLAGDPYWPELHDGDAPRDSVGIKPN